MLEYKNRLKKFSKKLRNNATDAELKLWYKLRKKQVCNVQFYRQKPIGKYIVDFYAPAANLIIEIDGSQHFESDYIKRDIKRDAFLVTLNLQVLRFDNLQVLQCFDDVLQTIFTEISNKLGTS